MTDKYEGHGGSYVVKDGKRERVAHTKEAPRKKAAKPLPAKSEKAADEKPSAKSDNKAAAKPAATKE